MKDVLGITPRETKDTIIDMAYSVIEAGLVKKSKKYKVFYKHLFTIERPFTPLPDHKILASTRLKAYADDKLKSQ